MIRYGVIGGGRMGRAHAGQIKKLSTAVVTAVYDLNPEAADRFAADFGARIEPSAARLAAAADVDCVIITSPTYCHQEGVRAAMAAGKAIFCEKALCRDPKVADELLAEVEKYDKPFTVGFVRRHIPKTLLLKQLLEEGRIGRLRFCNVDLPLGIYRRMPGDWFADYDLCGGVIIDMMAHHVDLMNWFFGPMKRLYADGLLLSKDQPEPADYAASVVRYENGVIGNILWSWQRCGRSNELMEIYGDEGALSVGGGSGVTWTPKGGEAQVLEPEEKESGPFLQFRNLTDALEGKKVELPTIRDAWDSLAVAFAMIESVKSGKAVEFK